MAGEPALILTEWRIGELLTEMKKAGTLAKKGRTSKCNTPLHLADVGLSQMQSSRLQAVFKMPAIDRGDGKKYAEFRCVEPANGKLTGADTCRNHGLLDGAGSAYVDFEHFQPGHAREIAKAFDDLSDPKSQEAA